MPIYKADKLTRREHKSIFKEDDQIKECNIQIDTIIGSHRDENNEFYKKLVELEHAKIVRKALADIVEIKRKVYYDTGIIL
jgi:hypothetical protein